jgi:pre-rRNA-processing protein TSR3
VKEKRSKCSLVPVERLENTLFRRAKEGFTYEGTGHLLLSPDAPEIGPADAFLSAEEFEAMQASGRAGLVLHDGDNALRPVLLLDSVWRLLPGMRARVTGRPVERSLPRWLRTAYPRVSKMTDDPECGLATVEALYAAVRLMGFDCPEILDGYRWRDDFLKQFDRK